MASESVFFQAFVYLAAAVVAVPLSKRLGLGSVLGYLIAGTAIGPFALGLIGGHGQDVMHFAEFGVVMMLFLIGLELQPNLLWRMRLPILGMGGLQVLLSAIAVGALAQALGLPWRAALATGSIIALSSTAIVLQTLAEKGLMQTDAGQRAFAVLLFQDLAVIPLLALLPLLATHRADHVSANAAAASQQLRWIDTLPASAQTLAVLGAVAVIVVAGRSIVRPALRFIAHARLQEIFTAGALLLVIGIALLMGAVGLSPALGTFLAGVVLASSEYRHELESDIEPFKGLLLGLFFISVGSSIDFGLIAARPLAVSLLVAALVAIKLLVLLGIGRLFRMSTDQNLLFGFSLAQGGEFAFVLLSFAVQHSVLPAPTANLLVAVVALSMALTPLLMFAFDRLISPYIGTREALPREPDAVEHQAEVIVAGFGRFGNVLGRLLRANGVAATVLDIDSDQVDALRRFGFEVYYGDASREALLRAAGAESAKVLVVAIDDSDRTAEIVRTAKKHFPQLRVLARARGRIQAYDMIEAGADRVYRETFDTALRAGADVLRELGFRAYQAERAARTFRRYDEQHLRDLAAVRHDQQTYVSRARENIAQLDQLLRQEQHGIDATERDAAWDTSTLRAEVTNTDDR